MMGKKVLAFDFGASSGRAVVFELADGKLCAEEIHRFDNDPVMVRSSYCWDVLRLFHEIKQGILKCKNAGAEISAIGIDTWGVDYGLLDKEGRLCKIRTTTAIRAPTRSASARKNGAQCLIRRVSSSLLSIRCFNICAVQRSLCSTARKLRCLCRTCSIIF